MCNDGCMKKVKTVHPKTPVRQNSVGTETGLSAPPVESSRENSKTLHQTNQIISVSRSSIYSFLP